MVYKIYIKGYHMSLFISIIKSKIYNEIFQWRSVFKMYINNFTEIWNKFMVIFLTETFK